MNKSLVFFDLDGTLLNNDSIITNEIEESIVKLKENGHLPVIATGRPYSQIVDILENTIINSYVLVNGQKIIVEEEIIFKSPFEHELIQRVIDKANLHDIELAYYGSKSHAVSHTTPYVKKALSYFNIPLSNENNKYYEEKEVLMMLLFTDNLEHDKLFEEEFPELNFYRTSPYTIDVIHAQNSKATSIDKLKSFLRYDDIPTYAFGDGLNDIEMLKNATYSIAMGNAVEEVKKVSDIIVSSNEEAGIIEGLKFYNLI